MAKSKTTKPEFKPIPIKSQLVARIEETLKLVRALAESAASGGAKMQQVRTMRLRIVKCTQENFDKLPGLVPRAEFVYWTGISSKDLSEEVAAGRIAVHQPKPDGYALYYKREIARLTGFKL